MFNIENKTKKNKFIVFSNKTIFYENDDNFNILSVKLKNLLSSPAKKSLSVSSFSKCNFCSFIKTSNSEKCFCQVSPGNGRVFSDIEFIRANSLQTPVAAAKEAKNDTRVLIFCIDVSGSMANHRLDAVKKACDSTLDVIKNNAMNDKYKIGLVTFSKHTQMLLCDNTNITLPQIDPNRFRNSDDIKAHACLKSSNMGLDLLRDCEANLRRRIQSITSESGTLICTALFYSVLLASETPDSEIILCTDGEAQDFNSPFYDVIIQFAKLNLTRINVITFAKCDCGLYLLGKLASETNGKLSQSTSALDLKFDPIIPEPQSDTFMPSQIINIYLHSSESNTLYFILDGGKKENSVLMKNLNSKTEEVLLGFGLYTTPSASNVIFQLIIDLSENLSDLESATRLRVVKFSHPIGVHNNNQNFIDNEQLVHAFVCRQVSRSIVNTVTSDNIDAIRNLVKKYRESNYLKQKPNDVEELIDLFQNRFQSSNTQDIKNIKDADAAKVYTVINVTSNKFSESQESGISGSKINNCVKDTSIKDDDGQDDENCEDDDDDEDCEDDEKPSNYEMLNQELISQIENLENILLTASSLCDKRSKLRKKAELMVKSSKMHTKNSNIRFLLLCVLSELLKELKLSTKYTILLKSKQNTNTSSQSELKQAVLEDGFFDQKSINSLSKSKSSDAVGKRSCKSQTNERIFESNLFQSSGLNMLASKEAQQQVKENNSANGPSKNKPANFGSFVHVQNARTSFKPESDNAGQCSDTDEEFFDCMDIFDRVLQSLRNASSQLATKQTVDELVNEFKSKLFMLIMPEVEESMSNSLSATEKIVEHLKELDVYDDDHT